MFHGYQLAYAPLIHGSVLLQVAELGALPPARSSGLAVPYGTKGTGRPCKGLANGVVLYVNVMLQMRGSVLLVSCLTGLVCTLACHHAQASPRMGRERALASAVQVIVETRFGTTRRCSGYLYTSNGFVVTTFHAISDATSVHVLHADYGVLEVDRVRRIDQRADIAVLSLANTGAIRASLARIGDSRLVKAGDPVHVMHHPAYGEEAMLDTTITNVGYPRQLRQNYVTENYASEMLLFELEGAFDVGSAGGMVLNEQYELIGIIIGGGEKTANGRRAYALASSFLSRLLISSYFVTWDGVRTNYSSGAQYFDRFFGPAPQMMDFGAPMQEGYLVWFAPVRQATYNDYEFNSEINDKIDKNWFYTSGLVVDGRRLKEFSASRIFVVRACVNPWGITNRPDRYVHFDADSLFSKVIYKQRRTEERIMTRHLMAMPLKPGIHTVLYENKGANFKSSGIKRQRITIEPGQATLLDIEGLSLVSMLLLPSATPGVGEAESVRYELERRPLRQKEVNFIIRSARYPLEP
ncbi:trypsin-like peptidase domain-containing protein [bacterium]|nr:trypsin-like peptidase domain-containing protein [bacterium]